MLRPPLRSAVLLAVAASCLAVRAAEPITDGLVATVNGEQILFSEVAEGMPPFLFEARNRLGPAAGTEAVFRDAFTNALRALEDRRLVLQKYREGDMRLPEHAIDRYTGEILESRFGGNLQALQADLAKSRKTYSEWRSGLEEQLIVNAMRHSFVDGNVHVSPNDIAQAYEARKDELRTDSAIRLFVAEVPEESVATFRGRFAAGEPFDALAREFATDPLGSRGGDLGFVSPDDIAEPLAKVAAALPDGGLSEPVAMGGAVYLVSRQASRAGKQLTLAEAWDTLKKEMENARREELFDIWVGHLRAAAAIRETLPWDDVPVAP